MGARFDDRRRVYVVSDKSGKPKEFPEQPGLMDYAKEGLENNETRAQLEAARKQRQKVQGS